jgi:type II secretory pathway pseudopilin PulG
MSPNDSSVKLHSQKGFTLVELGIVAVLSLIVGVTVVRFYRDSYHTYSMQEQIEERNQNANFTVSKMVEIMQQAGAYLPDSGWAAIRDSSKIIILGSNPGEVTQFIGTNPSSSQFVRLDDVSTLRNSSQPLLTSTHILVDTLGTGKIGKFAIDTNYGSNGFVKGLKDKASGGDSLRLVSAVDLRLGDWVYGYREDQYLISTDSLVIRPNGNKTFQMVLAENIDSLGFTFRDIKGNPTTLWKDMRSVSLVVRAKTSKRDPRIPKPGYHLITLPMNVILRNKA